jgi:hypothetical protein
MQKNRIYLKMFVDNKYRNSAKFSMGENRLPKIKSTGEDGI